MAKQPETLNVRMPAPPLTLDEAAAHFRVKRRFFQDVIAKFPFYRTLGRRKLFFPDDIERITDSLNRPSTAGTGAQRKRRFAAPAAPSAESTLNELRELLASRSTKSRKIPPTEPRK